MSTPSEATGTRGRQARLADLVRNISYEVMPFAGTEQAVRETVPTEVPLTVTVTEAKGIERTLEVTERLRGHGYDVTPHLPARQFVDDGHVADVVDRLDRAGVRSVFVIGGDAPTPAGAFEDAHALLETMAAAGHPFTEVGIGGYPEGHASIPTDTLDLALKQKAPRATRVLTQICFDADTTVSWARGLADKGIDLPVRVGMPGPVNRKKLMRISAGIGLGQSARFLRKQQNMLWRFLLPGGYDPTRLAKRLARAAADGAGASGGTGGTEVLTGLHVFTFNELAGTESWRQRMLASLPEGRDHR